MQPTTVGQHAAKAVQDSFYCGLIGQGAGRIQQSPISIFSTLHKILCVRKYQLLRLQARCRTVSLRIPFD